MAVAIETKSYATEAQVEQKAALQTWRDQLYLICDFNFL